MTPPTHSASALDDARTAVQRSDEAQLPTQETRTIAVRGETEALRDALRALIQHVEHLEKRIDTLSSQQHKLDRRTIGSQVIG